MTNGIIIGRFLPLQTGHVAMSAPRVPWSIISPSCSAGRRTMRSPARRGCNGCWRCFRRCASSASRGPARTTSPVRPTECERLRDEILALHRAPIDRLIASDRRQGELATALGTLFTLIDPEHQAVPVTTAQVRANPLGHWRFIPPAVRPTYAHKICLHGPESTGKTTLAPQLAQHFDTLYVPNMAAPIASNMG